jgi:hypothetical protein
MRIWLFGDKKAPDKRGKMKKAMLIAVLLVMTAAMFAHKSMYDLQVGEKFDRVKYILKSKGFGNNDQTGQLITYDGNPDTGLPDLQLAFTAEDSTLASWNIVFDCSKNPERIPQILEELSKLHGAYDYLEEFDVDYIWYFPENRALYVYLYMNGKISLHYAEGNWDDDDWDYYEGWW